MVGVDDLRCKGIKLPFYGNSFLDPKSYYLNLVWSANQNIHNQANPTKCNSKSSNSQQFHRSYSSLIE